MTYNYYESMKEDILQYINDEINLDDWVGNRDGLEEQLNNDLWIDDAVTGNGSGSYTFNSVKAREYVLDNVEIFQGACSDFGISAEEVGNHFLDDDWEYFDVTIRCCLLSNMIADVLDDLEESGKLTA